MRAGKLSNSYSKQSPEKLLVIVAAVSWLAQLAVQLVVCKWWSDNWDSVSVSTARKRALYLDAS